MHVRRGDIHDWPFIYDLGKLGIPASISPWRKQSMAETLNYREAILRGFWTWIQQTGSIIFIAEQEKRQAIGYLVLHPTAREELTGLIQGWVMDVAVAPGWRRKGAGRELLKAAEDYCREQKITYLGLAVSSHNIKALTLYESLGFAEERKLMVKSLEE